jgi:gamma-glutamyl phosphate reductase
MSTTNGTTSSEVGLAKQAKKASLVLGALSLDQRNEALQKIYSYLISKKPEILAANALDMNVRFSCAGLTCRPPKDWSKADSYKHQW